MIPYLKHSGVALHFLSWSFVLGCFYFVSVGLDSRDGLLCLEAGQSAQFLYIFWFP